MTNWLKNAMKKGESESKGFFIDIEEETIKNNDYRRVLFTAEQSQLVLMSLKPGVEIGLETHDVDQFFRFEAGQGKVRINETEYSVKDGDSVIIPRGTSHNVWNTSDERDLKLYSIYSPPHHKKNTVHKNKEDEKEQHFDGSTDV